MNITANNTNTNNNSSSTTPSDINVAASSRTARRARVRRHSMTAGLAATLIALGCSTTGAGAVAPTTLGQPPVVTATPFRFGDVDPGATGTATTTFDALASGPLSVTSPDPAVFTVSSISSSIVTTTVVDTSGDLRPGARTTKPLYSTTLTPDGWVSGSGPLIVTKGERIKVTMSVSAPATTPPAGLNEVVTVNDAGAITSIPVSVRVISIWAEQAHFVNGNIHPGQTLTVPLVIHYVSGPDTDVVIDSLIPIDMYGFTKYGVGTDPLTVHVTNGDTVVPLTIVTSKQTQADDYGLYVRMTAFGTASKVTTVHVRVTP